MILGVDPGVRGGMAVLDSDGKVMDTYRFAPGMTRGDFISAIVEAAVLFDPAHRVCFMEKVGYIRGDGGQGAFTFGRVVGLLEGAIEMIGFKIYLVSPMMWQSAMGCLSGGNKNVTKALAVKLFPGEKVTHGIADALLIAEHGRRRQLGLSA